MIEKKFEFGNRQVTIQTGKVAKQTDASAIVSVDETVVLATVASSKSVNPDQDFFSFNCQLSRKILRIWKNPWWIF